MRWPREWGDQTSFENIEESEICVAILMTFRSSSPQIAFCRRDALLLHCKCHSLDEFGRRNSMRKKMRRQNKMEITNWVICHRMIARGLNEPIYRFRSQPKARKTISSQNEWKKRMINFVRRKHILNDRILSITFSHKTKCKKAKTKRSLLVRRQFAISKLLFFFFFYVVIEQMCTAWNAISYEEKRHLIVSRSIHFVEWMFTSIYINGLLSTDWRQHTEPNAWTREATKKQRNKNASTMKFELCFWCMRKMKQRKKYEEKKLCTYDANDMIVQKILINSIVDVQK